ncbi:hypothetical protein LZ30DRAFT_733696 [Colletotrichum cereale]|nr:hypothetical protein LZ30DRAFT_733696 [Colletotrichum cereale]
MAILGLASLAWLEPCSRPEPTAAPCDRPAASGWKTRGQEIGRMMRRCGCGVERRSGPVTTSASSCWGQPPVDVPLPSSPLPSSYLPV